ncbi:MAG: tetratricopeptide repeat protein [Flavobacteriales bacterium]|nr:tetratricopeptide repeat protein [Flavobacteriales bacterium]
MILRFRLLPGLLALSLLTACGGAKPLTSAEPPGERGAPSAAANDKRAEVMRLFMEATQARLQGQLPKALGLYQQCLKVDPLNAAAMFELAKLYHQGQNYGSAVSYAKQAVAADKGNIWYRFLLADLYRQGNKPDEAIDVYRGILDQWPERYEVHLDLAAAYAYGGKATEAAKAYAEVEKRFGLGEDLVHHAFSTYMALGQWAEAEKLITRAIAASPSSADYVAMLAEVYDEQGLHDKALAQYRKALALDPSNSMLRISLAEHYYTTGKLDEAYNELGEAFLDPEVDIDAKMQVLIGFFEMTEHEGISPEDRPDLLRRSYALIESLERAHPESGKPHTIHGDFLLRDGKISEARDEFRKALALEKDRFPIHAQVLQLDLQLGDHESLVKEAAYAIELFPTVPEPYLYKGIGHRQLDQHELAIEALVTGRDLVVDNPPLTAQFWSSLGEAYNASTQYAKSDQAYDKALALQPDDPTTLNNYAYYLSLRGEQLDKAERMSKRSNELAPGQPSYQDTYAWVLFRMKRYADARAWMEKAIAASPTPDGELLEHYGDILFELGEATAALDNWRLAKQRGGASDSIDRKINEGRRVE